MDFVVKNQFIDIDKKKKQVHTYYLHEASYVRQGIICRTNPRFVNQRDKFKGTYL